MAQERTTISIRPETRELLFECKCGPGDTYDEVINRLVKEEEDGG